jgi:hypothetical protein
MLPHWHLVIGAAVAAVVWWAVGPDPLWTMAAWSAVAGAVGAGIDLDIMAIVRRAGAKDAEVAPWADPRAVFADFKGFLRMLRAKGLLRTAAVSHVTIGVLLVASSWLLVPDYVVPVAVGVVTHLASDVQYLRPT